MVVFSEDAHLLKLLLSNRGPEGVATWARDADLKLGLGLLTSLMSFEETNKKKTCNKKEQKLVKSSPAKWRGWKRSVNKISTSNYIVKIKIYKDTIVASWCRAYVLLQGTPKRRVWVLDKHHQWVHWLAKLRQTVLHLAARYLWRKICYWPKQFFFKRYDVTTPQN